MKHTKKLVSLLLTLVMVLSMSITAFAKQEGTLTGGTITINNAVNGQTYKAYQIMYLESYNASAKAYSYKANSAWEAWLKTQTSYVSVDENGYITWAKDTEKTEEKQAAEFAKAALEYAKGEDSSVTADATVTASSGKANFTGLNLGYYLVDSSLGVLCSLDTTNKEAIMQEKNEVPTVDKTVKEGDKWGDFNTAKIGDTVEFKTTIYAKKGAQNYVLHDQMTKGLTLDRNSIVVTVGDDTLGENEEYEVEFDKSNCSFKEESKICNFEIKFAETYLNGITEAKEIVVTYKAILNSEAEIYDKTNKNQTRLDYGDSSSTEWDTTETKTFQFDLVKTDSDNKLLNGAKFELYNAKTGDAKIELVKETDGSYRVATADEQKASEFTSAVIEAGKVTVKGIDVNTSYWLEEIEAPAGYNKLAERVEVRIDDTEEKTAANLTATMNGDTWSEGGVHVINQTGAVLPSTGGIGTTIIYVAGSVLVLAAAVLLITKKRMSREE